MDDEGEVTVFYRFDFDRIKTIKDVKRILEMLDISVSSKFDRFPEIEDLLVLRN